jgi:hypothetical protein
MAAGTPSISRNMTMAQRRTQAESLTLQTPQKGSTSAASPNTNNSREVSGYDSAAESYVSDDASHISSEFAHTQNAATPRSASHAEVKKQSAADPRVLIGWQILIQGEIGVVIGIKRYLGRSTKFEVRFENGTISLISLKRSDKKGQVPFSLISKVNS